MTARTSALSALNSALEEHEQSYRDQVDVIDSPASDAGAAYSPHRRSR